MNLNPEPLYFELTSQQYNQAMDYMAQLPLPRFIGDLRFVNLPGTRLILQYRGMQMLRLLSAKKEFEPQVFPNPDAEFNKMGLERILRWVFDGAILPLEPEELGKAERLKGGLAS